MKDPRYEVVPDTGSNIVLPQDLIDSNQFNNDFDRTTIPTEPGIHTRLQGESFTMYSRPSAFGPPCASVSPGVSIDPDDLGTGESLGYDFGNTFDHRNGFNYPFTPPYYHGEAWMDILFEPTSAGKVTIEEIFNNSRTFQLRFWQGNNNEFGQPLVQDNGASLNTGSNIPSSDIESILSGTAVNRVDGTVQYSGNSGTNFTAGLQFTLHPTDGNINAPINFNAMQVSASVNVFNKASLKENITSINLNSITIDTNTENESEARWIIQSKFETPTLNFNHVTHQDLEVDMEEVSPFIGALNPVNNNDNAVSTKLHTNLK